MAVLLLRRRRSQALERAMAGVRRVFNDVSALRNASAAGTTNRPAYWEQRKLLLFEIARWQEDRQVAGIIDYARDEYDTPGYDFPAEMVTMIAAAQKLADWLGNNLPTHPTGEPDDSDLDAAGVKVPKTLTSAQAAPYRAQADLFLATIDNTTE